MKVAISGVTGLVGRALSKSFIADSHEVIGLTRRASLPAPLHSVTWDVDNNRFDASGLEGVDAVVHLAGESVAQRWNARTKTRIRESRVKGTRLLVEALKSLSNKPKVLVSASAVGFYGDRGDEPLNEESPPGSDYLADVCQQWESEALKAEALGIRTVLPRIGIVLSTKGGALKKMLLPFKLCAGGPVGSGSQWMSWIHIEDLVQLIRFAIDQDGVRGPVNATAPNPAINKDFTAALARALGRPAFMPAPGFALRLAFGEMADALLLGGQRVQPDKTIETGYQFRHPNLEAALKHVVSTNG